MKNQFELRDGVYLPRAGALYLPMAGPPPVNPGSPYFRPIFHAGGGGGGGGGPAVIDSVSNASPVVGSTTISWTHTCSGSDRVLFVGIGYGGTSAITSVTYNGVAMAQLWKLADSAGATTSAGYILGNAASGANTVVVTFAVASDGSACGVSFTNGDTASPNRTPVTAQDPGSASNTSVTVANAVSGDIVIDCTAVFAAAHTVGSGQTSRYEVDNLAGNNFSIGISTEAATGSTVMDWTHAGTFWVIGACAIKPKP